ncbi:PorT family protein [Polaribacter aestuariivivens]|uniref:PorT family protein n=1 Tax=Polaribacter aestuariivivens TaxID=2304626 RepID=A0A5S3N7G5_9FLAO|nr:porin family protein [Polaribacter aestuariivivens]TMM31285.1 PorT family protein [Polaribacter aestuariivivens]
MKKVILVMCLAFAFSQTSNAQINFGLKGGINYNNAGKDSFKNATNDIADGASAKTGFHAGLWFRGKIPILGLYLRPELVYTQVKTEFEEQNNSNDYSFKKLDVPVLLGKKFLGFANAFIGPSFQYIIDDNISFNNLSSDEFDKFSVGLQMGFGVEFGKLGLDVRWERGLSDNEAKFASNNGNFTVDNRTNQIIFGVSLQL